MSAKAYQLVAPTMLTFYRCQDESGDARSLTLMSESLSPWLRHNPGCPGGTECTCGLSAAAQREADAWFEVAAALRNAERIAAERELR